MRNVPSVTMKLGSRVRITSRPLSEADAAAPTTSAASIATQTFQAAAGWRGSTRISAGRCRSSRPADRSNSPPIISSATATAMMPSVGGRVEPVRDARGPSGTSAD